MHKGPIPGAGDHRLEQDVGTNDRPPLGAITNVAQNLSQQRVVKYCTILPALAAGRKRTPLGAG